MDFSTHGQNHLCFVRFVWSSTESGASSRILISTPAQCTCQIQCTLNPVHCNNVQVLTKVGVTHRVEQAQLQREHHAVGHLDVAVVLLHVLEPLEVQRQDERQLLDAHALLRLLVAAARVALELVVVAERLRVAEALQAVSDAGVLVHVHLECMNDLNQHHFNVLTLFSTLNNR